MFFPFLNLVIVISTLTPQVKSTASLETAVLKTATDSLQYSAGAFIGAWLKNNSLEQCVDQSLFKKGMQDCFKNKKVLTDSLIAKNIDRYLVKIAAENGKMQEQQLFAALRANANIGILPGGVCYEIINKGMGKIPRWD